MARPLSHFKVHCTQQFVTACMLAMHALILPHTVKRHRDGDRPTVDKWLDARRMRMKASTP